MPKKIGLKLKIVGNEVTEVRDKTRYQVTKG